MFVKNIQSQEPNSNNIKIFKRQNHKKVYEIQPETKFQKKLNQQSKFVQSIVMVPSKNGQNQCTRCKNWLSHMHNLNIVNEEITQLKQKNGQLKQQLQIFNENFKYILQLTLQNISNKINKIRLDLKEKQMQIQSKNRTIQKIKGQYQSLMGKVCQNMESRKIIGEFEKKANDYQQQNQILKKLNKKYLIEINRKEQQINRLKQMQQNYLADSTTNDDLDQHSRCTKNNRSTKNREEQGANIRSKRIKTFEPPIQQQKKSLRHVSSVQNLRFKLNNIKQQMEKSFF